jgi:hypothetical protein
VTGERHRIMVRRSEKKNFSEDLGVKGRLVIKWAIRR